jgi:phytoene dehydrogenase-like protein
MGSSDERRSDNVELVDRIRAAAFEALSPWADSDDTDTWRDQAAEQVADAVLADLHLQKQTSTYWTLYNAAEQAHRMSLSVNDGVFSIEEARERMAPYHPGGQGYEVVERTSTYWSTPVHLSSLPVDASGRSTEP